MMSPRRDKLVRPDPSASLSADALNALLRDPESLLSKKLTANEFFNELCAVLAIKMNLLLLYFNIQRVELQKTIELQSHILKLSLKESEEFGRSLAAYYHNQAAVAQAQTTKPSPPPYIMSLEQIEIKLNNLAIVETKLADSVEEQQVIAKEWNDDQNKLAQKVIDAFQYKQNGNDIKIMNPESEEAKNVRDLLAKKPLPAQIVEKLKLHHMAATFNRCVEGHKCLLRKANTEQKQTEQDIEIQAKINAGKDLNFAGRNITGILITLVSEFHTHIEKQDNDKKKEIYAGLETDKNKTQGRRKVISDALTKILDIPNLEKSIAIRDEEYITNGVKHHNLIIECNAQKADVNASLEKIAAITKTNPELHQLIEDARKSLNPSISSGAKENIADSTRAPKPSV